MLLPHEVVGYRVDQTRLQRYSLESRQKLLREENVFCLDVFRVVQKTQLTNSPPMV